MVYLPVVSLTGSDIVESNPGKFRLGESELKERKDFVERTRESVQVKLPLISFSLFFFYFFLSPGVFYVLCVSQLIWASFRAMFQCFEDIYSESAADCDT